MLSLMNPKIRPFLLASMLLIASAPCLRAQDFCDAEPVPPLLSAPPAAPGELGLYLRPYGTRSRDGITVPTYELSLGDDLQDAVLTCKRAFGSYQGVFQPFALDAEQFYPVPDREGAWRLYDLRASGTTHADLAEWAAYLDRPGVRPEILRLMEADDFGQPGEFIYKRAEVGRDALPAPLNRVSAEALAPFLGIVRYRRDGAIELMLRDEYSEEAQARLVFQRLADEIRSATP